MLHCTVINDSPCCHRDVKKWMKRRTNLCAMRQADGAFHKLLKDLVKDHYRNFLRVDLLTFETLLAAVEPKIARKYTVMRPSVSLAEQLAVTLRYLATS